MPVKWIKYAEIFVDQKFNNKVVCVACKNASFMDVQQYWDHVDRFHWAKYRSMNSTETHTDFNNAAAAAAAELPQKNETLKLIKTEVSKFIDLTDSDDEFEFQDIVSKKTSDDSNADAAENKFEEFPLDDLDEQLSRIHGEGQNTTNKAQVSKACASIPTPEASPVENYTVCLFENILTPKLPTATTTENNHEINNVLEEEKNCMPSRRPSSCKENKFPLVSIPLNQVQIPSAANQTSDALTYEEHRRRRQLEREQQQQQQQQQQRTAHSSNNSIRQSEVQQGENVSIFFNSNFDPTTQPQQQQQQNVRCSRQSSLLPWSNPGETLANDCQFSLQRQQQHVANPTMETDSFIRDVLNSPPISFQQQQQSDFSTAYRRDSPTQSDGRPRIAAPTTTWWPQEQKLQISNNSIHQQHFTTSNLNSIPSVDASTTIRMQDMLDSVIDCSICCSNLNNNNLESPFSSVAQQNANNSSNMSSVWNQRQTNASDEEITQRFFNTNHATNSTNNAFPFRQLQYENSNASAAFNNQRLIEHHSSNNKSHFDMFNRPPMNSNNSINRKSLLPQRRYSFSSNVAVICPICPNYRSFKSKENFEHHFNTFHNSNNTENTKTFYCDVCERKFMKTCQEKHQFTVSHNEKANKQTKQANNPGRITKRRMTVAYRPC